MPKILDFASWYYTVLLRLYPRHFQQEFADEMQDVFVDATTEARKWGLLAYLAVVFREVRDLPVSLAREYRNVIVHKEGAMNKTSDANSIANHSSPEANLNQSLTPWWQAVLAGLPHLLYPLSIEIPTLVRVLTSGSVNLNFLHNTFWVLVVVALVFGWRSKWLRWSASWVGYGLVMAFGFLINTAQTYYGALLENVAVLIWLVLTAAIFFWMAKRDWLSGLLVVLPVTHMFFTFLGLDGVKGTVPEGLYFMAVGLLMMLVVIVIVRTGNLKVGVLLVLLAFVVIHLPVSYATTYYSNVPPQAAYEPTISDMVRTFFVGPLVFLIFAAPLWSLALWTKGRNMVARYRGS